MPNMSLLCQIRHHDFWQNCASQFPLAATAKGRESVCIAAAKFFCQCAISPPRLGPLFIIQSNNMIKITWPGPGTLQYSASLPAAAWTSLTNATSTYSFPVGNGQQFSRLAQ